MLPVLAILFLALAPLGAMAQGLADIDPKEARISLTMQEFRGMGPTVARRRVETDTSPGLDYLVFSASTHVAVVNHQYSTKAVSWPHVDLVAYVNSVDGSSSMQKTFGSAMPYSQGDASGTVVAYAMKAEKDDLACIAYDVRARNDRLTGFVCLPGTAPITPDDAKRMVDGIVVKG